MIDSDFDAFRAGDPPLIPNLGVADPKLIRGGQPLMAAWPLLAAAGVNLVINLRDDALPEEEPGVTAAGMRYVNFPMSGWKKPNRNEVDVTLDRIAQEIGRGQTVYCHCKHGDDRTGTICACYRIRQGWTAQEALKEATSDGMNPLEVFMKEFVESYGKKED